MHNNRKFLQTVLLLIIFVLQCLSANSAPDDSMVEDDSNNMDYYGMLSAHNYNFNDPSLTDKPAGLLLNNNFDVSAAAQKLSQYYLEYYKNKSPWLQNTAINFGWGNQGGYFGQLTTVQPLFPWTENIDEMLFLQLNLNYASSQKAVGNIGLGYRLLSGDFSTVTGINVFYDIGQYANNNLPGQYFSATPSYVHQRIGLGLEQFCGIFEARFNAYTGLSAPVTLGYDDNYNSLNERVATGMDLELGGALPFAKYLSLFGNGYYYFKQNNAVNWNGGNLSGFGARMVLQATPQVAFETGGGLDSTNAGNYYFKFNYNLLANPKPALFGQNNDINLTADLNLQNKLLQPVLRNSDIVVERYTKNLLDEGQGQTLLTVVDASGAVVNATVALYRGNCAQSISSNSYYLADGSSPEYGVDQNGQVYFSNLPAGSDYYFSINNGSTTTFSGYFQINGNQCANLTINVDNTANLDLAFIDQQGAPILYNPLQPLQVQLYPAESGQPAAGTMGSNNIVALRQIPAGQQQFSVSYDGGASWSVVTGKIAVQGGSYNSATIQIPRAPENSNIAVNVAVTDANNRPVSCYVQAWYAPTATLLARTQTQSGIAAFSFTSLTIPPAAAVYFGNLYFVVEKPDGGYFVSRQYFIPTCQQVTVELKSF